LNKFSGGITMGGKRWTNEEISILKKEACGKTYAELLKYLPHRTRSAIEYRCQKLGLNTYIRHQNDKSWSSEDIAFLKNNHGILEISEIANKLNRTSGAINYQISKLGMNCRKIWSKEEVQKLLLYHKVYNISQMEELLKFNKTKKQIRKKLSLLQISVCKTTKYKYNNLIEVFEDYKKILEGSIKRFKNSYSKEYDILLFKYYLKKNNIVPNKEWVYNLSFSKILTKAKLHGSIKRNWGTYYNFISHCFSSYELKEYNFKKLPVPNGFWEVNYNCYDHISFIIDTMIEESVISCPSQIINMGSCELKKYFNKTMLSTRGVNIFCQYLDFKNIKYYNKNYWDGIKFDSMEEMNVYRYIKNSLGINIKKYQGDSFYNKKYQEGYIPDFILNINDTPLYVEYFGMYILNKKHKIFKKYIEKTHRKNEYFNSLKDIDYLALYPEDLQDNFKGIKEKIMPFYYEKFHKERM